MHPSFTWPCLALPCLALSCYRAQSSISDQATATHLSTSALFHSSAVLHTLHSLHTHTHTHHEYTTVHTLQYSTVQYTWALVNSLSSHLNSTVPSKSSSSSSSSSFSSLSSFSPTSITLHPPTVPSVTHHPPTSYIHTHHTTPHDPPQPFLLTTYLPHSLPLLFSPLRPQYLHVLPATDSTYKDSSAHSPFQPYFVGLLCIPVLPSIPRPRALALVLAQPRPPIFNLPP